MRVRMDGGIGMRSLIGVGGRGWVVLLAWVAFCVVANWV